MQKQEVQIENLTKTINLSMARVKVVAAAQQDEQSKKQEIMSKTEIIVEELNKQMQSNTAVLSQHGQILKEIKGNSRSPHDSCSSSKPYTVKHEIMSKTEIIVEGLKKQMQSNTAVLSQHGQILREIKDLVNDIGKEFMPLIRVELNRIQSSVSDTSIFSGSSFDDEVGNSSQNVPKVERRRKVHSTRNQMSAGLAGPLMCSECNKTKSLKVLLKICQPSGAYNSSSTQPPVTTHTNKYVAGDTLCPTCFKSRIKVATQEIRAEVIILKARLRDADKRKRASSKLAMLMFLLLVIMALFCVFLIPEKPMKNSVIPAVAYPL